ncbi:hypothetical protein PENSPDRAFT_679564 [Peniophora sp. CONT]|nr:hypothetical protein PENSPDRAFT_679564 [Peniophora sp. CONT]
MSNKGSVRPATQSPSPPPPMGTTVLLATQVTALAVPHEAEALSSVPYTTNRLRDLLYQRPVGCISRCQPAPH